MAQPLTVRDLLPDDRAALWEWYQEPLRYSFLKTSPHTSKEKHAEWCTRTLSNPEKTQIFIGLIDIIRIGAIRFDRTQGDEFQASFMLRAPYLGKGVAPQFLREGISFLRKKFPTAKVRAVLRVSTPVSKELFTREGFVTADGPNGTFVVSPKEDA